MNIIHTVILSAVFLGAYEVEAQCYNCTYLDLGQLSDSPAGCADPFIADGIQQIPCSGQCVKSRVVSEASGLIPAITATVRSCSSSDFPCVAVEGVQVDGGTLSIWCCNGALCNGQGNLGFSGPLTVCSLLTAALFFR